VVDTCQSTTTSEVGMPPCPSALSGAGARRVHNTTLSGAGSPDATPSLKGYGTAATAERVGRAVAPATASPPRKRVRRETFLMVITMMVMDECRKARR
jgi:hypothetical protein